MSSEAAQSSNKRRGWLFGFEHKKYPGLICIGQTYKLETSIAAARWPCRDDTLYLVACVPTFNPVRDLKLAHKHFATMRDTREEWGDNWRFNTSPESVQRYFHDVILPRTLDEDIDCQII